MLRRLALGGAAGVAFLVALWFATGPPAPDDALRVLVARKILTMEPDRPEATAVAHAAGRIVAVGSLDEVRAAIEDRPFELDTSFRDHVLVPGFIDPHVHPTLVLAILFPITGFVAAGFEHSVANMYFIPEGLFIKMWAPSEFWINLGTSASAFTGLTWHAFFAANLLPVTIGNIIGGSVLVGLVYWFIYLRDPQQTVR